MKVFNIDKLPILVGIDPWYGHEYHELRAIGRIKETIARIPVAPRLLYHRMVNLAIGSFDKLKEISAGEWMEIFCKAAKRIRSGEWEVESIMPPLSEYVRIVSLVSGLPEYRILKANETLAEDLERMETILKAQSPDGTLAPYQTWKSGGHWLWVPAGQMAAVRIPGNFPTINIMWLQVLSMRRPVTLLASMQDPFTPLRLAFALYAAGLPDGAISVCYGDAPALLSMANQIIWPGNPPADLLVEEGRLLCYHQGKSKVVILSNSTVSNLWERLAIMAMKASGRICTKLSALIVEKNVDLAASSLAKQIAKFSPLPLHHPKAFVPAFHDAGVCRDLAYRIQAAISRGAYDYSADVTKTPLICESEGLYFMRPTVLRISSTDKLFGAELPFPFVTVAEVSKADIPKICRNSLGVSLIGSDPDLLKELLLEPTISKLFQGEDFDCQYDPSEPHQGFVADFIFKKKAVRIYSNFNMGGLKK